MADSGVAPEIAARLRVGVSGHRTLTAELPGLVGEISKAVEYITAKLAVSADVPLTVVSSLAEGADRIVADAILGRAGARLEVVLPLPPDQYCADFGTEESRADFSRLLSRDDRYDLVRTAVSRDHGYELAGAMPLIEHVHWYYVRADQVAGRQQKRFRLVNRLLYILAPLAVLIVAGQVVFAPGRGYLAWFEFAVLAVLTVLAGALSGYAAQRDYIRHAERSRLFAGFLDRALDRLLAARDLDGIQQAALAISRSMRDEATDWYSAVHTQELELPA